VAAYAGFVLQRAEHVVLGATPTRGHLTVEIQHRAEELHGLVDEVAPQVEQDAATGGWLF
jgi:hypothetical protein